MKTKALILSLRIKSELLERCSMDVSVIIPCKNEAVNIVECISRVHQACPKAEILVIDSATDDTKQILNQSKCLEGVYSYYQCSPDRGKGDAIAMGMKLAKGLYVVQIDADLQFLPEDIPHLLTPLQQGDADMVLGSRFVGEQKSTLKDHGFLRYWGNLIVSFYCSLLFRHKISDALAGFKAWRQTVNETIQLESPGFSYEVELIAKALKFGFRVSDQSINYQARANGESQVAVVRTGARLLRDAFLMRPSRSKA